MPQRTKTLLPWTFLGLQPYRNVWERQEQLRTRLLERKGSNHLLLTIHPPTITLGRGEKGDNVRLDSTRLNEAGFDVVETNRGGMVTYHGPGQLVVYPVIDLRTFQLGVKQYICQLETVTIECLRRLWITAQRNSGYPGVWVGRRKIASVGIHVRKQVSIHGLALNVRSNLRHFDVITPCGISGIRMTSMEQEGIDVSVEQVVQPYLEAFADVFGCDPEATNLSDSGEEPRASTTTTTGESRNVHV